MENDKNQNDEKNDRFKILELINEDDEEEVVMRKIKEYCDQLRRVIREAAQKEIEEVRKVADEVTQRINNEEIRTINKIPNAAAKNQPSIISKKLRET